MKGRNPGAREKAWHTLMCQNIGCIACLQDTGSVNDYCLVHHTDGRTKPEAHWKTYPLCGDHHQGDGRVRPSRHKNQRHFANEYGTEDEILVRVAEMMAELGYPLPEEVKKITGVFLA